MLIKGKVLKILEENKGRNISGEEIAKTLNISRTSIWKAINSLRNEGYVINAVTNKGYSLATNTDFISKEGISLYLNKSCSDIEIYNYKTISSTNEIAKNLALSGAKHGTVVISEEQTAGKGRLGRSFYSPANTGIYMSIILRPNLTAMDSVLITTSSSVIICESIKKVTGIDCQIKWINDIYLNNKKGNNINRNMLCAEIISNILDMIPRIKNYDFISEYKKRSIVLNQEIIYISSGISSKGKAININCDGSLVVEHDDGSIKILNSGEVSIRRLN